MDRAYSTRDELEMRTPIQSKYKTIWKIQEFTDNNNNMNPKKRGCEDVAWFHLAQNRVQ